MSTLHNPANPSFRKLYIGTDQVPHDWEFAVLEPLDTSNTNKVIRGIEQFPNDIFDIIYCDHSLQTLPHSQIPKILTQLHRILSPKGQLWISAPDLGQLCGIFQKTELDSNTKIQIMRAIFGNQTSPNRFNYTGFTAELMMSYLAASGYLFCLRVNEFPSFNNSKTTSISGTPVTLHMVAFKSNPTESTPEDFVTLYQRGVEAFGQNDFATAYNYFEQAKAINSDFAPLWFNLGLSIGKQGQIAEAIPYFDKALEIDPHYTEALTIRNSLASEITAPVHTPAQSTPQHLFNDTTGTIPDYSERICRAIQLQEQGKLEEAESIYLEILRINPVDIPSLFSLGGIEHGRRNHEKATHYLEQVINKKPDYEPAWYNLGITLQAEKQYDRALECYDKAMQLDPTHTEVMVNRGALLVAMKRHKDALLNYEELIQKDPMNANALCNRAIILSDFKLNDLSIQTFERLIAIRPDFQFAQGLLCFEKMHACNWDNIEELQTTITDGIRNGQKICNSLAYTAISDEPHDHLLCAQIFASHYYPKQMPFWNGEKYGHRKIKVAYVSPDFREHPVGHLTAGIFELHNKEQFETIAISLGTDDGSVLRSRMVAAFDQFIDVRGMITRDIAAMIRSMEVDILIDLAGYTADSRTDIFAHRPAPVQVNYLGYSSTMGTDYYDYILADRYIIPQEQFHGYSEKVIWMPDTYLPVDSSLKFSEKRPERSEYGLPETGFVFCSFNHDYKINPTIFSVWMDLLRAIPGSILWLMKLNESAERNLRLEAEKRGVSADRIIFATRVAKIEDHLARYKIADLYLDTSPCNGHSTSSDVLRAGLPIITCRGKTFAGRVASGLLTVAGIPEMITNSLEEYGELARLLAENPDMLNEVKAKLQQNLIDTDPFNTERFCRNLEKAFVEMRDRSERGEQPDHFEVISN